MDITLRSVRSLRPKSAAQLSSAVQSFMGALSSPVLTALPEFWMILIEHGQPGN